MSEPSNGPSEIGPYQILPYVRALQQEQQKQRAFQQTLQFGQELRAQSTVHDAVVATQAQVHPLARHDLPGGVDHRLFHHAAHG